MSSRPHARSGTRSRSPVAPRLGVLVLAAGLLASCEGHTSTGVDGAVGEPPAGRASAGGASPASDALLVEVPEGLSEAVAQQVAEQRARIAEQPDDGSRYLELGMIYDSNSLPAAAAAAYEVAARLDTADARAPYHLGRMREVLGELLGAVEALEECVRRDPGAAVAHARLADLHLSSGDFEAAAAGFAAAGGADADHPAGPEGLARVALARGDPEEAEEILREQLQRHPERGYTRFLLGTACRSLGRLDEARELLEQGAGASPALPDPWLDEIELWQAGYRGVMARAVALGRAGEAGRIVDSLRSLREQLPDDVAALEKLVAAELQLGHVEEARAELDAFLERWPEHPRAWYLMALVLEAGGDLDGAAQAVDRSLAVQEDWVPAHELAARLAWRRQDLRGSAASMQRALHFGGPRHDTLIKLARAQALLGESAAARASLREASLAFPASAEVWIQLGAEALGSAARDATAGEPSQEDLEEAGDALARAAQLAPGDERLAQLAATLDALSSGAGGKRDG